MQIHCLGILCDIRKGYSLPLSENRRFRKIFYREWSEIPEDSLPTASHGCLQCDVAEDEPASNFLMLALVPAVLISISHFTNVSSLSELPLMYWIGVGISSLGKQSNAILMPPDTNTNTQWVHALHSYRHSQIFSRVSFMLSWDSGGQCGHAGKQVLNTQSCVH